MTVKSWHDAQHAAAIRFFLVSVVIAIALSLAAYVVAGTEIARGIFLLIFTAIVGITMIWLFITTPSPR
ncbi:MAG TPA: hypothetical protein VMH91_00615 [Candidatus Paceibacterota bacterium]|nr:hypothetical protein [Candidatus Paceibacterota bacterium]